MFLNNIRNCNLYNINYHLMPKQIDILICRDPILVFYKLYPYITYIMVRLNNDKLINQ